MTYRRMPAVTGILTVAVAATLSAALAGAVASPAVAAGRARPGSSGWRVIKAVTTPGVSLGDGVAAFSNGDAWVAGESAAQRPVLYHLAGGQWHTTTLPGAAGTFAGAISASGPSNVWVALGNEPDVAHLTSRGWKLKSFTQGSLQVLLDGVLTFGPSDTWVFYSAINNTLDEDTGYAVHYDGSTWRTTRLPANVSANGVMGLVSASSPGDIWALTYTGTSYETMHYDGHHWRIVTVPAHLAPAGQAVYLRQILVLSPTDAWVTGYSASSSVVGPVLLLHWNGVRWGRVRHHLPAGSLAGPIASDGNGGLWLAAHTPSFNSDMLHFANGTWRVYQGPHSPVPGQPLAVEYLVAVPGGRSVLGDGVINPSLGGSDGSAIVKYGP